MSATTSSLHCAACRDTGILVAARPYVGHSRYQRPTPTFCSCGHGEYEQDRWYAEAEAAADAAREVRYDA